MGRCASSQTSVPIPVRRKRFSLPDTVFFSRSDDRASRLGTVLPLYTEILVCQRSSSARSRGADERLRVRPTRLFRRLDVLVPTRGLWPIARPQSYGRRLRARGGPARRNAAPRDRAVLHDCRVGLRLCRSRPARAPTPARIDRLAPDRAARPNRRASPGQRYASCARRSDATSAREAAARQELRSAAISSALACGQGAIGC